MAADTLDFPQCQRGVLKPYLPLRARHGALSQQPSVTLTYATSLDSQLSIRPGVQTILSGPESKAMTHYLRARHDAILVGSGTAVADDPGLNCRLNGITAEMQPRPVILDRRGRWSVTAHSRVIRQASEGKGKAPWLFTTAVDAAKQETIEKVGGRLFRIGPYDSFVDVMAILGQEGIRSVMVEGGASIINEIMRSTSTRALVASIIVTIAPTYLGRGGVLVSPEHDEAESEVPVVKFRDVRWISLAQDVVMLARMP